VQETQEHERHRQYEQMRLEHETQEREQERQEHERQSQHKIELEQTKLEQQKFICEVSSFNELFDLRVYDKLSDSLPMHTLRHCLGVTKDQKLSSDELAEIADSYESNFFPDGRYKGLSVDWIGLCSVLRPRQGLSVTAVQLPSSCTGCLSC